MSVSQLKSVVGGGRAGGRGGSIGGAGSNGGSGNGGGGGGGGGGAGRAQPKAPPSKTAVFALDKKKLAPRKFVVAEKKVPNKSARCHRWEPP